MDSMTEKFNHHNFPDRLKSKAYRKRNQSLGRPSSLFIIDTKKDNYSRLFEKIIRAVNFLPKFFAKPGPCRKARLF
jgi:hypothetical protein